MSDKLLRVGETVTGKDEGKRLLGRPEMNGRLGLMMLMENVSQIEQELMLAATCFCTSSTIGV
jgi:hypothetical protein